MSDLTEFLLARIAEDEAAAREVEADNFDTGAISTGDDPWPSERAFAERFAPARVLAECAAKRQIVNVARYAPEGTDGWGYRRILRALATPYTDHPGYRAEWVL